MNSWKQCFGEKEIKPLTKLAWRVVEVQHKSCTRKLVDTIEEHEILEGLIESAKPKFKKELTESLDYLLFSPFRYPPLKYGSRFGRIFEPSLWYGSLEINTAFSEVAYNRLVFIYDTEAELGHINVLLIAYSVNIVSKFGIDLTKMPFDKYRDKISSPTSYEFSQPLGSEMRKANVEAFTYYSARSADDGINIAAFQPTVFENDTPNHKMQTWQCITNKTGVEFVRGDSFAIQRQSFSVDAFKVKGVILKPPAYISQTSEMNL